MPQKTTPNNSTFNTVIAISLVLAIGVLIFVVVAYVIPAQQRQAADSHTLQILFEMQDACDEQGGLTLEACDAEIARIMTASPAIVETCFKDYADIDTMMLYCLKENGIAFGD